MRGKHKRPHGLTGQRGAISSTTHFARCRTGSPPAGSRCIVPCHDPARKPRTRFGRSASSSSGPGQIGSHSRADWLTPHCSVPWTVQTQRQLPTGVGSLEHLHKLSLTASSSSHLAHAAAHMALSKGATASRMQPGRHRVCSVRSCTIGCAAMSGRSLQDLQIVQRSACSAADAIQLPGSQKTRNRWRRPPPDDAVKPPQSHHSRDLTTSRLAGSIVPSRRITPPQ